MNIILRVRKYWELSTWSKLNLSRYAKMLGEYIPNLLNCEMGLNNHPPMWKYAVNIDIRQHSWKIWSSIENCIRNDRENPCEEDWLPMKLYFEFLMLMTQIYCPLASASKLELLCVNDRILCSDGSDDILCHHK